MLLRRIKVSFTGEIKLAGSSGMRVVEKGSRTFVVENEGPLVAEWVISSNVRDRMRNMIVHVFGTLG